MVTRFVAAQGSATEAIDSVVDLANQTAEGAYNEVVASTAVLTTAQMLNGTYSITSGTTSSLTTATAAAIVAALKNAQVGSRFSFDIMNAGSGTATVVAGSGVTLKGVTAVPTAKSQIYRGVVTNATAASEAVTLVGVLTAPI